MRDIKGNRVIGFGDSITFGSCVEPHENWVSLLSDYIKSRSEYAGVEVFNAGVGGHTSREGLARFASDVKPLLPGLVIIEFGGNDAVNDPQRHVDMQEFEDNIRKIVRRIRNGRGEPVLMTFPPIVDEWHCTRDDKYYDEYGGCDGCVELYRVITRNLAKELGCRLIDLDKVIRLQMKKQGKESMILPDGVHLSIQGNETAAAAVISALELE